ncbi:MAG: hypothetical protein J6N32_02635, partial [Clostridia bacterium]|nr:hypothetical protein [Clostridia bacterium]
MNVMLPLDHLTDAAAAALKDHGLSLDDMTVAVRMDLDFDGNFGESWLIFDKNTRLIHRVLADVDSIPKKSAKHDPNFENFGKIPDAKYAKYYDSFSLDYYSDLTVDTCMASNRLLVLKHDSPRPEIDEKLNKDEKDELHKQWNKGAVTEIKAFCTNSKRQKLYAFCEIVDRTLRGDEIGDEDSIFDQFNAKCPKCGKVYENQYRRVCTNCVKQGAIMKRLLQFLLPYKGLVFGVVLCMITTSAISLINPILSGRILLDNVVFETGKWHNLPSLFIVLGIIFGLAILSLAISIIQNRLNASLSTRMTNKMKQNVFDAMMALSLGYFNKYSSGQLNNRVNYDADRIRSFYIDGLPHFIINVVNFIGIGVFLFTLNWQLTLMVFIPVPIIIVIFRIMLPKLNRMYSKQYRSSSSLNSMLADSLNGIRVVKAFAKEAEETNRFYG